MKIMKLSAVVLFSAFLLACGSSHKDNSLYYWGNYQETLHAYYENNGDYAKQEEDIRKIIASAKESNKQVAPGIYAHLGLLLIKQGRVSEGNEALQQEQALYPESRQFMQFLQKAKK